MWDALKNPAVYAALSGLMSALGFENANRFFEHMVGAAGAASGIAGIAIGCYSAWKEKKNKE